ncbi:hypothetical protein CNYM01_13591 [Colletotrichum nymphaeae SA-01]|uniref:Uncharacterized protein n=1 Tax=Colletotrichum nymphaeae SA-01 TaxID=1460502 RepID=A0A135S4T8_9PEZI|nr:hypothetical protein CNYM01_13591 [Colletotrichum nymphaeae SA-01]
MKLLAILTLAAAAAATGTNAAFRQRYAAVDMSPAVEGAGLVPRFFIDAPRLAVRDGGICNPNFHSCEYEPPSSVFIIITRRPSLPLDSPYITPKECLHTRSMRKKKE